MTEEATVGRGELLALASEIVAAHVGNNATTVGEVPGLIQAVFDKLDALARGEPEPAQLMPAVPIRRSVTDDYIICLEDGKKLKMLKRHLRVTHGMAPQQYRAKWGLRPDYPMVAAAYAETRTALAIKFGLGRKSAPPTPAPKPKRPRSKPTAA